MPRNLLENLGLILSWTGLLVVVAGLPACGPPGESEADGGSENGDVEEGSSSGEETGDSGANDPACADNTNYILAGIVAEQASSLSLGEALRSRVLDPSGLEQTHFDGEESGSGPLARSYYMGMDLTGSPDPSWAWAAGSMVATAPDLLRWTQVLFRGAVLDHESKAQLGAWVETGGTPIEYYGLGVFLYDLEAGTVAGHNGRIVGYAGAMGDRLGTGELAVVLFNTSEGPDPLLGVDAALKTLDGG